jgi:protein SCO1/2
MSRRLRLALAIGLAALLAALPAVVAAQAAAEGGQAAGEADREVPEQRLDTTAAGWPLAGFALQDHRGRRFTNASLQGQWTFLLFGGPGCGAPCKTALDALAGLNRRLAPTAKQPQVVVVVLAADEGAVAAAGSELAALDARFIAAGGVPATVAQLADELVPGLAPAAPRLAAGELAPYFNGSLYLVGPDGALRAEYLPPFDIPRLTATYLKMRLRG